MNLLDIVEDVKRLRDALGSQGPHYAVFDFDGSIIENDSAEAVLTYMARHDYPNAREAFEHYYSLLDAGETGEAYQFGAGTLKGLSVVEVREIVRRTMGEEGRKITKTQLFNRTIAHGIALRARVVELMCRLEDESISVWIVSTSPEVIVRAALAYFGLYPECIGVQNILRDGVITEALRRPLSIFEGKVDCIKRYIHPRALSTPPTPPLFGVGDSINDLPMLEYSRLRAVVDRGNELARIAGERGWFIL